MKDPAHLTAEQFALWLSGYVDLNGGNIPSFDAKQTKLIVDKLAKVELGGVGIDDLNLGGSK